MSCGAVTSIVHHVVTLASGDHSYLWVSALPPSCAFAFRRVMWRKQVGANVDHGERWDE